jgi:hypothetical protein
LSYWDVASKSWTLPKGSFGVVVGLAQGIGG